MIESLSPRERIRKKKDFFHLYRKGSRFRGKYFHLIYLANDLTYSRVGVVASHKVGSAVARNKVKRWMRELFRRNKGRLGFSVDMLIVAKPEMKEARWADLNEQYLTALKQMFKRKG